MREHYDLVIIGGGMVGASLAVAMIAAARRLGMSIAVIEAFAMPDDQALEYQPSYDGRATALAYGSRTIYQQIGIWDTLAAELTPIDQIHVSDRGHFGAARMNARDEGVDALGYVVENHWLGKVLLNKLSQPEAEVVDYICPATVTDIQFQPQQVQVVVEKDGQATQLTTELVLMSDGGRSELREKIGLGYRDTSYQQYAVVANVTPDRPHQQVAWERFTDAGPMALLPLSDIAGEPRCGLVWTVPDDDIAEVLGLEDEDFLDLLQQRFGYRAGRFVKVGERASYPLKLSLAEEQVRSGLVVLGNAAHALHPIAGQGYNLALRGVAALAEKLIDARERQVSLGDLEVLQAYYQRQSSDQQRTIGFSDLTMKLFSNDHPALTLGRDLGLQLLDICSPARTLFARSAMGIDQPAPKLK